MNRSRRRVLGLVWLAAIHGLLDLTVALYRCLDLTPTTTDVLAAVLMRTQVCLLLLWLMLGRESLRWRIAGAIGGVCFVLMIYTRLLFAEHNWTYASSYWYTTEWYRFFRASGPGDVILKLPALFLGIGITLALWRSFRCIRSRKKNWILRSGKRSWLQFSFQDFFLLTMTISIALAMLSTSAPYTGWFNDLMNLTRRFLSMQTLGSSQVVVFETIPYIVISLATVWATFSRWNLGVRIGVVLVCLTTALVLCNSMMGTHVAFSHTLIDTMAAAGPREAKTSWMIVDSEPNEFVVAGGATGLMCLSLFVFRVHDDPSVLQNERVGDVRKRVIEFTPQTDDLPEAFCQLDD